MTRADKQSYDQLADHYEAISAEHPDAMGDWLAAELHATGARAIDVGCGAGRHAVLIAERFESVVGVDVSRPMIELARATRPHPRVTYEVADVAEIDGQFDLVFSSAMLHHVADLDGVLGHLKALVAPAGVAVLADVTGPRNGALRLWRRVAPRTLYRTGAALDLVESLVRRRPGAIARFRTSTHRPWIDHLASDKFLTFGQFQEQYGRVFPGAQFQRRSRMAVCIWVAPPGRSPECRRSS